MYTSYMIFVLTLLKASCALQFKALCMSVCINESVCIAVTVNAHAKLTQSSVSMGVYMYIGL